MTPDRRHEMAVGMLNCLKCIPYGIFMREQVRAHPSIIDTKTVTIKTLATGFMGANKIR